jgi:tetratricopeptide (TPR) repeat protein
VLLRSDGVVQVFDFGLARASSEAEVPLRPAGPRTLHDTWMTSLSTPLTQYGAFVGTPAYTAPEQRGGEQVDERSDQFSFCVALYEGLCGNRPFSGENIYALELAKVAGRIDPPQRKQRLPRRLLRAVQRGLAPEPQDRWPSMPALLAALERLLPRRRAALLGAVGLIGLLGGALGFELATRGPVCTGATAAFADAWGEDGRAALAQAFAATGLAYAEDTTRRVDARLGEYQARWLAAHTATCEATHLRHSQSLELMARRLRCLDQRRDELAALLTVFAAADAEVVRHAVTAAAALPAPETCVDLIDRGRDDPSADPARLAALAEQRRRLATAAAQASAGHYDVARTIAAAVLAEAGTLADRPLQAEARAALGTAQVNLTTYAEAEATLVAGFFDALALAHDDLAVNIGVSLSNVVGDQLARPAEGRIWAGQVLALLDRNGHTPDADVAYLTAIGNLATRGGEYGPAEAAYRDALARVEAVQPPDDLAIAEALVSLAGVLGIAGEATEAIALETRALALREAALGPLHPDLGNILTNLGTGHMLLGEFTLAEQCQRRALEIWRVSMPPGHERLAYPLSGLGDLALERGRFAEARADFDEAFEIWKQSLGPDHPSALFMQERLATTLLLQGEREAALRHIEQALGGWEKIAEPDPGGLTLALLTRAQIAITLGDFAAAREPIERAHTIAEQAFGPAHIYTLATRMMQQGLLLETGQPAQALAGLVPLLADYERENGPDSRWLIETLLLVGRARHALAHTQALALADKPDDPAWPSVVDGFAAARRDLERAQALCRKHDLPAVRTEVDLALARALWDGDLPHASAPDDGRGRARALALAAAETQRRLGAGEALRQTEAWLREHP